MNDTYLLKETYKLHGIERILTDSNDKTCRFCGHIYPDVQFNEKAHAVSEFSGNTALFNSYECDNCNHLFQKYETSFADYFKLYRGMRSLPKKAKGKKKRVSPAKGISTLYNANERTLKIKIAKNFRTGNDFQIGFDENGGTFIATRDVVYVPMHFNKLFAKMTISLLPESLLPEYSIYKNWLQEESIIEGYNKLIIHVLKQPVKSPAISLYIRNDSCTYERIIPKVMIRLNCMQHMFDYFLFEPDQDSELFFNLHNLFSEIIPKYNVPIIDIRQIEICSNIQQIKYQQDGGSANISITY